MQILLPEDADFADYADTFTTKDAKKDTKATVGNSGCFPLGLTQIFGRVRMRSILPKNPLVGFPQKEGKVLCNVVASSKREILKLRVYNLDAGFQN